MAPVFWPGMVPLALLVLMTRTCNQQPQCEMDCGYGAAHHFSIMSSVFVVPGLWLISTWGSTWCINSLNDVKSCLWTCKTGEKSIFDLFCLIPIFLGFCYTQFWKFALCGVTQVHWHVFHATDNVSNQEFALPSPCQLCAHQFSNAAGSTRNHKYRGCKKNLEGGCKERAKCAALYAFFLN